MKSRAITGVFLVICLGFCGGAWCQEEPAGEGRPITPAGTLVIDATTHLPAVGAMPMAMLRSPDSLGHGGKGRYLLVVNSGFGVQFSEDTNRAQQSIAVIDLNASPEPLVIQNVYFPTPQSANVGLAFSPAAGADGKFEMYVSNFPSAPAAGEKARPTFALCGVGKYTFWITNGSGLAFRSITAIDCWALFVSSLNCTPNPLFTTRRYRPLPPCPRESGLRSIVMGMAPTAGRCVVASITSVPAGVIGRPSPAGSSWQHAPPQKPKQIIRKPPVMARDFICLLPRSSKIILFFIIRCRSKSTFNGV